MMVKVRAERDIWEAGRLYKKGEVFEVDEKRAKCFGKDVKILKEVKEVKRVKNEMVSKKDSKTKEVK